MKEESAWEKQFRLLEEERAKQGSPFHGKHRKARMVRFAAKNGSNALKKKLAKKQQAHERAVHAKKQENRKNWHRPLS